MRKNVSTPSTARIATVACLNTFRNIAFCDVFAIGETEISTLMTRWRDASHLTRQGRFDDHPPTNVEAVHCITHLSNVADDFMSKHKRR